METKEEKRATFTPGPWKVSTHQTQIHSERYGLVAALQRFTEKSTTHANARLIAAAPDLLDALKNVKRALGMPVSLEAIRLLVDEAIHKAEVEVEGGEG